MNHPKFGSGTEKIHDSSPPHQAMKTGTGHPNSRKAQVDRLNGNGENEVLVAACTCRMGKNVKIM